MSNDLTNLNIRIPRRLKEEMDKLKKYVDWNKEIIEFIEERVKHYRRMYALREIDKELEKHPTLPKGFATRSIREDRDQR